jgi:DNA-directed RNA polymerase II subunit RPB7
MNEGEIERADLVQVEGTCSERYGFVLRIWNIDLEHLEGRINPTGMNPGGTAVFTVPYDAIVFKPFRGEILNGIVKSCAHQGVFVQCGPLQVRLENSRGGRVPFPA